MRSDVMPRLSTPRTLTLEAASARGRRRHLSAASGLVLVGGFLYVLADDEHHLGVFRANGRSPGKLARVRSGTLPAGKKPRKRRKPDFEAIVALPAFGGHPFGALLALGSGSRSNRCRAVVLPLDASGALAGNARGVALDPWYDALGREFREVNIEGAFVDGRHISLLQRGNKGDERNARIRVALAPVLEALGSRRALPRSALRSVANFELGACGAVPLCFTDGASLPDGGFAFTAVAEDTDDSYADGDCAGSAIGIADDRDRVRALWRLEPALKVEGIAAKRAGRSLELTVVTDADDASVAARAFRTRVRWPR